jgi:hypothetical protein
MIKKPTQKLARWINQVSAYDFDIRYKPGKEMIGPDTLSRRQHFEELNMLTYEEYIPDYIEKGILPDEQELAKEIQDKTGSFTYEEDQLLYRTKDSYR